MTPQRPVTLGWRSASLTGRGAEQEPGRLGVAGRAVSAAPDGALRRQGAHTGAPRGPAGLEPRLGAGGRGLRHRPPVGRHVSACGRKRRAQRPGALVGQDRGSGQQVQPAAARDGDGCRPGASRERRARGGPAARTSSCRSPGWRWTSPWPISTGRSTTWCRSGSPRTAVAGCRVRVRFAGQLTGGYLLERAESSDHPGRLAALERVLSPESVLSPEIAALARAVADRYAGTMADVLRLAIPPRHARAEAAATQVPASAGPDGSPPAPGGSALPGAAVPCRAAAVPCRAAAVAWRLRNRGRGRAMRLVGPSWPRWLTGGRRGQSGRPCPARTGRRRSRALRRRRPRAGGARSSLSPTAVTSIRSMRPWAASLARAGMSPWRLTSGQPSATGDGSPSGAA